MNRAILFCSQRPPLEPVRLPAPVGGPRQAPPAGVQPESAAAAAEEAPGEPRLQIASVVRDDGHLLSPRNQPKPLSSPTFKMSLWR